MRQIEPSLGRHPRTLELAPPGGKRELQAGDRVDLTICLHHTSIQKAISGIRKREWLQGSQRGRDLKKEQ